MLTIKTVLVTGSRDWDDTETIQRVLDHVVSLEYRGTKFTLREGGARGADKITREQALILGWSVETFEADWSRYKKGAGFIRNKAMVETHPVPSLCIAFIRNNSRGATMCAELAEDAGIPTLYYRQDDTEEV